MIHHSTPKLKFRKSKSLLYSAKENEAEKLNVEESFDGRAEEVFLNRNDPVKVDEDPDFDGSISAESNQSEVEADAPVVDLNNSLKSCRKIGKALARSISGLDQSLMEEKSESNDMFNDSFDLCFLSKLADENEHSEKPRARKLFDVEPSSSGRQINEESGKPLVSDEMAEWRMLNENQSSAETVPGLTTAGGKPILISDRSLERAKKLLNDVSGISPEKTKSSQPKCRSAAAVLPGLTTATGKPVLVSNQSLDKAKKLLLAQNSNFAGSAEDIEIEKSISVLPGLSTASGKPLSISDQSLAKAKHLLNDNVIKPSIAQSNSAASALPGLSTAAGKPVLISNQSLDKAKKLLLAQNVPSLFSAENLAIETSVSVLPGLSTESGKPLSISNHGLAIAKQVLHEEVTKLPIAHPNSAESALPGLSTAAGKPVLVSNQSLDKAKKLLHAQNANVASSAEDLAFEKSLSTVKGNLLPGLSTASGKPLSISNHSLAKAKQLLHGEVIKPSIAHPNSAESALPGLCTAAGKAVLVSNQSLDKAKRLLLAQNAESASAVNLTKEETIPSLVTMENVPASAKAKHLLYKVNETPKIPKSAESGLPGLSTAAGKPIMISNQSLDEAKKLLHAQNAENSTSATKENALPGLSTASGKPLLIPNHSLAKAKQLLHEEITKPSIAHQNSAESALPGLSTAAGKRVLVSNRSLEQAKNLLHAENLVPNESFSQNSTDTMDVQASEIASTKEKIPRQLFSELDSQWDEMEELIEILDRKAKRKSDADFTAASKKIKRSAEDELMINSAKQKQKEMIENKDKNDLLKINKKTHPLTILGETIPFFTPEDLACYGVDDNVINVTSKNASNFKFILKKSEYEIKIDDILLVPDYNLIGLEEIKNAFLTCRGVNPTRIPQKWVENHYRWIVWKLSAYETKFPRVFAQKCLTPKNVLEQLKYRYYREIQCNEKCCFRKILDGDEPSGKPFICCVSSLENVKIENDFPNFEITDGWYAIDASIDSEMVKLVRNGKVRVGTKLVVNGAEMVSGRLKIHTNSTRRVKWYAKMGFCKPSPLGVALGSVLPQGGHISLTTAVVARIYPTLHMSKDNEGKTVFRNDQMQFLEDTKNDRLRGENAQDLYEKIVKNVESDMEPQVDFKAINLNSVKEIDDPETLYVILKGTNDSSLLTEEQINLAQKYHMEMKQRICQEAEIRVGKEMSSTVPKRKVTKLKRIRLVDYFTGCSFLLTMWNLNEIDELKEGQVLDFYNLTSCGIRDKIIQLSSTKNTKIAPNNSLRVCLKYKRKVTKLEELSGVDFEPVFDELDVLAVVVYVWKSEQPFGVTKVFLSDLSSNYLMIAFWTSLDKFGCEEILEEGSLVSGRNLQWRNSSRSGSIPCVYATETSYFSQNPKQEYLREEAQSYNQYDKKALQDLASDEKVKLFNLMKDSDKCEFRATPCHKRIQILSELSPVPPISPVPLVNRHPGVKKSFVSPFRAKN